MKYSALAFTSTLTVLVAQLPQAYAQVKSETDLFGGPEVEEKKSETAQPQPPNSIVIPKAPLETEGKPVAKKQEVLDTYADSELIDKLQIGGRLELRSTASDVDDQRFQLSPYKQSKTADIYFDTRPNKDTRAFLRLRFYEDNTKATQMQTQGATTTPTEKRGVSGIQESLDELWLKWDVADTLFVTAGKQHVKWGRGRFWNPTDFTALEAKDPFAVFDRRLGQEMIKLHLPFEKQGHNFYAIAEFDDTQRNDDVGLALRGEFSIGENGETAISLQSKRGTPLKLGLDFGMGFGNFDVNLESAFITRDTGPRYKGDLDIPNLVFPSTQYDDKKLYNQSVANVEYVWKYNDDDNLTLGLEGFWNEMGYDKRILEFYSLIQNRSKVLYSGKQYAAAYMRLAAPGNWNDSTFIVNAVKNISDRTALARLTAIYTFYKQITAEVYVSRCFGEYGELCFRVPDSIQESAPLLPANLQVLLNALPKKTTRTVFGGSLSMNF